MSNPSSIVISRSGRPSLLNSFALYLMMLGLMIGLHSLYQRFLVPLLEGPPQIVQLDSRPPDTELTGYGFKKEDFRPLFPADAWENDDCKLLVADQGIVLFREFVRVEGGYLEVLPFTLIMDANVNKFAAPGGASDNPKTPTVLRCEKGARLKFDDPHADPLSGKAKLESARLVGNVNIFRPSSGPQQDDSLEILTSNVQITNKQIFTIEEVRFAFGLNRGIGRQLAIELTHQQQPRQATQHGFENVDGVSRIELAYLKQLRLEQPSQASATNSDLSASDNGQPTQLGQQPIDITCTGPFVLDVLRRTAVFYDQVLVRQVGQVRNEVECERLTVQFVHPNAPDQVWTSLSESIAETDIAFEDPSGQHAGAEGSLSGDWEVRRMIAEGSPAVLTSDEHRVRVRGDFLSYDLKKEELYCRVAEPMAGRPRSSGNQDPRKDPRKDPRNQAMADPQRVAGSGNPVTIVTPEYRVSARELAYRADPQGRLGQVLAAGPGSLLRMASEQNQEFFVQWKRLLSVEPDNQQHLITVEEDCLVRLDEQNLFKAQQLQVWLDESLQPQAQLQLQPHESASAKVEYQPRRLIAKDRVEVISPQLNGKTNHLTAVWDSRTVGPPMESEAKKIGRSKIRVHSMQVIPMKAAKPVLTEMATEPPQQDPSFYSVPQNHSNDSRPMGRPLEGQPYEGQRFESQPGNNQRDVRPWQNSESDQSSYYSVGRDHRIQPAGFQQPVANDRAQPKRYAFVADQVQLQLRLEGSENKIDDFTATGQVQLAEVLNPFAKTDQSPLVITGQQLRYVPQGEDLARVVVIGSPDKQAVVEAEKLVLKGLEIHLDQVANKLWVDGPGELTLDVDSANAGGRPSTAGIQGLQPGQASNYQQVRVNWLSGMVFNGRKIYFEDEVNLLAEGLNAQQSPLKTSAFGAGVSVELNQSINFSEMGSSESNLGNGLEIRELVIVDQVATGQRVFNFAKTTKKSGLEAGAIIQHQLFDSSSQLSEQIEFTGTQITLVNQTGLLTGKGPGFLTHYRKGESSFMDSSASKNKPANPIQSNRSAHNPNQIAFLRVNYDGTAVASTQQQKMQIRGKVRTVYSPVNSFQNRLNPDDKQSLPVDAVVVKCDSLDFVQWTPRNSDQPVQELFANGNAHVTSGTFEAVADRINYNQSTDLVIIEGTPRSDAQLWHRTQAGNVRDRKHLIAEKIIYRLKDGHTEVQNVKNLDYKQQ